MTDNDSVASMIDELLHDSPGATLRQGREETGLSVKEVAEKLRLLPRQIEAIENDQYQDLNGDIFCRGYLKSYANLLGITPEPLLEAYQQFKPQASLNTVSGSRYAAPVQKPGRGHSLQYWCLALLVLVLVVLWMIFGAEEEGAAPSVSLPENVVVDRATTDPVELSSDTLPHDIQSSAATGAGTAVSDGFSQDAESIETSASTEKLPIDPEVAEPEVAAIDPAVAGQLASDNIPAASQADTADNSDVLSFSFVEDCWVEVKDKSGQRLFADLKRGGSTLSVSGQAPFDVLLGYAPGVNVALNGQAVVITPNTNTQAARLKID